MSPRGDTLIGACPSRIRRGLYEPLKNVLHCGFPFLPVEKRTLSVYETVDRRVAVFPVVSTALAVVEGLQPRARLESRGRRRGLKYAIEVTVVADTRKGDDVI